jgi:hypothetical protein
MTNIPNIPDPTALYSTIGFIGEPFNAQELDLIALYLGYAPNSEVIRNATETLTEVFNAKIRECLWNIKDLESKVLVAGIASGEQVIQVEDIKFNPNANANYQMSLSSLRDRYLKQLSQILRVPMNKTGDDGVALIGISYR